MKTFLHKGCVVGIVAIVGCSTFKSQVPIGEPHATLRLYRRELYPGSKDVRVASIDGQEAPRPKKGGEITVRLPPGPHEIIFRNKARIVKAPSDTELPWYVSWPLFFGYLAGSIFTGTGGGLGTDYGMETDHSVPLQTVVIHTTNRVTLKAGKAYWTDGLTLESSREHER